MDNQNRQSWEADYGVFCGAEEVLPPKALSDQICARISRDLHPSELRVFSRLALVHMFAGSATLFVCPQFGFSFTAHHAGLMSLFMKLGPVGCVAACGAFFISISALIASLLLKPEEIRVLRGSRMLQLLGLALLSLGVFVCFGGAIVPVEYGIVWVIGALLVSVPSFEIGLLLRLGDKKPMVCG